MCKELDIEDVIGLLVNPSQENQVTELIKESVESGLEKKGYEYKDGKILEIKKEESKFKVGDWVIDKQGIVHQIANVVENIVCHTYGYDIVGGGYFNDNAEGVRLWTIQDAKDGDILAYNDGSLAIFHYRLSGLDGGLYMSHVLLTDKIELKQTCAISNSHPATKEQRDLLFAKMKEEGYEWDAEKKELKKIEQKSLQYNGNEIILVEVVDGEELVTYSRAFSNIKDAVEFFRNEFLKRFQDPCDPFSDEDIDHFINDGYYADEYHSSIIIKNIPFNVKD